SAPSPRCCMGMAYDGAHGKVVLFGGSDFADTWTWDGTLWKRRTPAHAPSPRCCMSMAYDAAHGHVVQFGGNDANDGALGATGTWDGPPWTRRRPAPAPSARACLSMAYDAAQVQVVLFGGTGRTGGDIHFGVLGDTWTWDGTDWRKHTAAHAPSARDTHGMAY